MDDHLAPLDGGEWAVWRWVGVRSAGFPVERLQSLADPECAAAADRHAWSTDEAERYLQARRWKRGARPARFAFVRTSLERKPFFVDLDSPVSVDVLSRAVRRTGAVPQLGHDRPGSEVWRGRPMTGSS